MSQKSDKKRIQKPPKNQNKYQKNTKKHQKNVAQKVTKICQNHQKNMQNNKRQTLETIVKIKDVLHVFSRFSMPSGGPLPKARRTARPKHTPKASKTTSNLNRKNSKKHKKNSCFHVCCVLFLTHVR